MLRVSNCMLTTNTVLSLNVVCSQGNQEVVLTGKFKTLVLAEWIERMRRLCRFEDSAKLLIAWVTTDDGKRKKLDRSVQLMLRNFEKVYVAQIDINDTSILKALAEY